MESGHMTIYTFRDVRNVALDVLNSIQGPLGITCADEDVFQTAELRNKSTALLNELGWPYQVCLYSHVHHGFAVRRAVTTKEVWAKKMAFVQAIAWMDEYLVNGE